MHQEVGAEGGRERWGEEERWAERQVRREVSCCQQVKALAQWSLGLEHLRHFSIGGPSLKNCPALRVPWGRFSRRRNGVGTRPLPRPHLVFRAQLLGPLHRASGVQRGNEGQRAHESHQEVRKRPNGPPHAPWHLRASSRWNSLGPAGSP